MKNRSTKLLGGIINGRNKISSKRITWRTSESPKNWTKELRSISWNGRDAKYDIRDWAPEDEKMGKGVTLSLEELKKLKDLLNEMDL